MMWYSTRDVAEAAQVDDRSVQRWVQTGALVKHPNGFTDAEREIAVVLARFPSKGDVVLRRRVSGALRRQLLTDMRWDGLALCWPAGDITATAFVPLEQLEHMTDLGVLAVLPLPSVVTV